MNQTKNSALVIILLFVFIISMTVIMWPVDSECNGGAWNPVTGETISCDNNSNFIIVKAILVGVNICIIIAGIVALTKK